MTKKVDLTKQIEEIAKQTGSLARVYIITAGLSFATAVFFAIFAIRAKIETQVFIGNCFHVYVFCEFRFNRNYRKTGYLYFAHNKQTELIFHPCKAVFRTWAAFFFFQRTFLFTHLPIPSISKPA